MLFSMGNGKLKHYRVVVTLLVLRAEGESNRILVQRRRRPPFSNAFDGYWEFPQGKIDAEESVQLAIERELREETGLSFAGFAEKGITCSNECDASLEALSPFQCVRALEPYPMIGMAFLITATGEPTSTLEASGHTWVAAKELKELLDSGRVFPLNVPMMKKIIDESILEK